MQRNQFFLLADGSESVFPCSVTDGSRSKLWLWRCCSLPLVPAALSATLLFCACQVTVSTFQPDSVMRTAVPTSVHSGCCAANETERQWKLSSTLSAIKDKWENVEKVFFLSHVLQKTRVKELIRKSPHSPLLGAMKPFFLTSKSSCHKEHCPHTVYVPLQWCSAQWALILDIHACCSGLQVAIVPLPKSPFTLNHQLCSAMFVHVLLHPVQTTCKSNDKFCCTCSQCCCLVVCVSAQVMPDCNCGKLNQAFPLKSHQQKENDFLCLWFLPLEFCHIRS